MTGPVKGIITKGVGGLYTVLPSDNDTELLCSAKGIFRLRGITPLPGDRVVAEPDAEVGPADPGQSDRRYVITSIEPRRNCLIRPPLSNLTHTFLVIPSCRPKPDLLTADKLTAILENADIEPVIVVSKADLDPASAEELRRIYVTAGYRVFVLSASSGDGCDALSAYISEEAEKCELCAAFAGVSGAGKSTLLTRLFPTLDLKTGTVSRKTERGRHTTRCSQLYPLTAGGSRFFFADTPGFSMLDFTRFNFFSPENLPFCFREFADCLGKCRYAGCTHVKEEGCAVIEKADRGEIARSRHENFVLIREEMLKKPEWKRQKEEKAASAEEQRTQPPRKRRT